MADFGETHSMITVERPLGNVTVNASRLELSMDYEGSPYILASADCPLGDGMLAGLNPQERDVWAVITVRRTLGRIDRLWDLTRRYGRGPLSDITEQFAGDKVLDITRSTYHDYSTPGVARRDIVRTFRLMLRTVKVDRKAANVTLDFASGEARLRDWQHMSALTDRVPGANLNAKINYILTRAGFPEGLSYTPVTGVPNDSQIGDEAQRAPGSTALDFLRVLTRKHGFWLWCDEFGKWHLDKDRLRSNVRTVYSSGENRSVINETSSRSRDDTDWVTAVMVIYKWQGVDHYDIASPLAPNPENALILTYERPYPGPGLAQKMLDNIKGRGRAMELEAVSDYMATPGETVRYVSPRETVEGRLAATTWTLPEDEMSIRLRNVKEVA